MEKYFYDNHEEQAYVRMHSNSAVLYPIMYLEAISATFLWCDVN